MGEFVSDFVEGIKGGHPPAYRDRLMVLLRDGSAPHYYKLCNLPPAINEIYATAKLREPLRPSLCASPTRRPTSSSAFYQFAKALTEESGFTGRLRRISTTV